MVYDSSAWQKRLYQRTDMSTHLVHLTRSNIIDGKNYSAVEILLKIIEEQKLEGSTTQSGFIVGSKPAVCFQETPLVSVAQSLYYEQQERKRLNTTKIRYSGVGLMFDKRYVYENSGRPVIYETTKKTKEILRSSEEWWRIVDLNHEDENNVTDWTHEREWRVPGNFTFERKQASVIVANVDAYRKFIAECCAFKCNILKEIQGIVTLTNILM